MRPIALVAAVSLSCLWPVAARDNDAELIALIEVYQQSGEMAPSNGWPDLSANGLKNLEAHDRAALAKLHAISRKGLSPEHRELYDLLEWQIDGRLDQMRVRLYLTPFWTDPRLLPQTGLLDAVAPLWSLPNPVTLSEYEERIRKLEGFPEYVKQVIALLREAKAAHMLPARQFAWQATRSGGRWLNDKPGAFRNPFLPKTTITEGERKLYDPFQTMQGIETSERVRLQETARKLIHDRVIPAAGEYYDVLSEEYLPACPESPSLTQWPNGAAVYRVLLRLATTTDLEPKQVQEFGLREVKQIRNEMAMLVPQTGFRGSLNEFLLHLRNDPEFYFKSDEELLAAYRGALQRIEPRLPIVVHHIPKLSVRVEPVRGGAAAWYEAPNARHSDDLINVEVGTPGIHPKFEVLPLMLHEGLPGHALQHAVAREFTHETTDAIAAFEQEARQSTGFGEGWGLYSESLGYNLGLYRTPIDKFGALRMRLTRAVRVAVDTGIHLSGWSLQQAKDYAAANTGEPEAQIELEVGRSIWPAVQPAYAIGEQQIEAMRDTAANALGRKFDLHGFNDTLLRWGPLPLEVMRRKVEECLADARCSQTFH